MKQFYFSPDDGGVATAAPAAPAAAPAAPAPAPTAAAPAPTASAPAAPAAAPTAQAPAPAETKGYWPDDWRSKAAKGDDKMLNRFARYGSPEDALSALIAAQDRISKGELKPVLDKNATPEQIAEWRAANGIPDAPTKYEVFDLGGGLKVPDADKPLVDKVLVAAHASNQTPDQIKATLRAFYEVRDMVDSHVANQDKEAETKGQDALRQEWGSEYRVHSNLIANLLDGTAGGIKDNLLNGRLADGTLVKNSPEMQKFLLSLALIQNPLGTVVPGGGNPAQGIQDELARIKKTRETDRGAYNKDEKMQARERELIEAAVRAGIMDSMGNWKNSS
jgi:hypothetical protein